MQNNQSQKFFLYARKSTDVEDKQILSIEAQLAEVREYAKREGIDVLEELIEKQSAKIPGRPIFNSMVERIEKGEANGIVSWNPDRLARNSIDGGRIIYLIDIGKIRSLKFPTFWFEPTPQGKFMLSISFGQSKYYVDSLSENTKRGLRQKVRRGEYPGPAPVGYINDSRNKTIILDLKKSKVIRKAFEKYSNGNYLIKDISQFLAKKGILNHAGKTYRIDWITKQLLTNPFYYGHFRYGGEVHEGIHKPTISKKLFDAVQEVLNNKRTPWRDAKLHKFSKPFLGLFRCGECGMMITGEQKTKYYPQTDNRVTYIYYRCTKKSKTHKCKQPFIRQEDLDSQLSSLMQKVSLRRDWAKLMLLKLSEDERNVAQSYLSFVQKMKDEIKVINNKLQLLLDSYIDQIIDKDSYRLKKSELLSQKKTIEEKIITFEQTQNGWLGPMREWINEAANAANIAKGTDLNAKKVIALKIFGSDLRLENKKARGEALNPWAALCAAPTSRSWVDDAGLEPAAFTMSM